MVLAVFKDGNISIGEAFLIAAIAILIVFLVLGVIIFVTWALQKGMEKIDQKEYPGDRHEILNEDNKEEVEKDIIDWIDKQ